MTEKKKHLIELMIEAGVKWPESAEYAAQDKNQEPGGDYLDLINIVSFYRSKPEKNHGEPFWFGDSDIDNDVKLPFLCNNWHQTIVTREQYEKALADAGCGQAGEMPSKDASHPATKSIEQLAADYHAKAEEAQRLQSVADDALKLADDALIALEKAGEAIGLVISIDTSK